MIVAKEKQEELNSLPIVEVVEEFVTNLATALFINEQGGQDDKSTKKSILMNISNQHLWNFKPSPTTKSSLLDLLYLVFQNTGSLLLYFPKMSQITEQQIIPTLV